MALIGAELDFETAKGVLGELFPNPAVVLDPQIVGVHVGFYERAGVPREDYASGLAADIEAAKQVDDGISFVVGKATGTLLLQAYRLGLEARNE